MGSSSERILETTFFTVLSKTNLPLIYPRKSAKEISNNTDCSGVLVKWDKKEIIGLEDALKE